MIYVDESTVKVGGVILPGLFKSIEVKTPAMVEEQDVEGKTAKPKQAVGYEDAKITLELTLDDGPTQTKLQKLAVIQNLFRKPGQTKPIVYDIVNEHTAARGVTKVIFKELSTKEQSKKNELSVSIEFWEYIPMTITATKTTAASSSSQSSSSKKTSSTAKATSSAAKTTSLTNDYKNYLTNRGAAPKQNSKTSNTPASDTAQVTAYKNKLAAMPY